LGESILILISFSNRMHEAMPISNNLWSQFTDNPLMVLSVFGILLMFMGLLPKMKEWLLTIGLVGLLAGWSITLLNWENSLTATPIFNMLTFDRGAIVLTAIMIATLILIFLVTDHKSIMDMNHLGEYYALMIFALIGGIIMVSFKNLLMLFIGVEILSIASYILAGFNKKNLLSNEASLKYFLMGSFASGILLMGITLVYGMSGSFDLEHIAAYTIQYNIHPPALYLVGILLLMVAFAFKVSAAPFHFWAPDVYQGAPTISTAFMSTVVKTAAFGAFYRLFSTAFNFNSSVWNTTVLVIVGLTLVIPNLTATRQTSLKRILAYSGIANAGFLMMVLLQTNLVNENGTHIAQSNMSLYLTGYVIANIIAFAALFLVKDATGSDELESFKGLAKRNPYLSAFLTIAMCSMAGIPATAGFMGKYFIISGLLESGHILLSVVAVLMSVVSLYYYFKVIKAMYMEEGEGAHIVLNPSYVFLFIIGLVILFTIGLMPHYIRDLFLM